MTRPSPVPTPTGRAPPGRGPKRNHAGAPDAAMPFVIYTFVIYIFALSAFALGLAEYWQRSVTSWAAGWQIASALIEPV